MKSSGGLLHLGVFCGKKTRDLDGRNERNRVSCKAAILEMIREQFAARLTCLRYSIYRRRPRNDVLMSRKRKRGSWRLNGKSSTNFKQVLRHKIIENRQNEFQSIFSIIKYKVRHSILCLTNFQATQK